MFAHRPALLISSQDQGLIARCVREGVQYDPSTDAMLHLAVRPGDIACDIGANFGYFTRTLADLAFHVHAFEPDPGNFLLLEGNLEGCDNVTAYPCALSDRDGYADFFVSGNDSGFHSLFEKNVTSDEVTRIRVKTRTLDSFDFVPQVVKCDAQGAEPSIFRGATKLLAQPRVFILFEFWPWGIDNTGENPWDFLMSFQKHGLVLCLFADGKLCKITPGTEVKIGAKNAPNFVACRGYDTIIGS